MTTIHPSSSILHPSGDVLSMRVFACSFFTEFGADVYPDGDDMLVILPPELVDTFGKPRLYLTFADEAAGQERELSPDEDLLSYGSRVFEVMLSMLAGRGEKTHVQLAAVCSADIDPTMSFGSRSNPAQVQEIAFEPEHALFFAFHFRAEYRWAEKEEQVITVILDEAAQPRPDKFTALYAKTEAATAETLLAVDAAKVQAMFERAGQLAQPEIDARSEAVEKKITARLGAIAGRLNTFYRRLEDELGNDDPAGTAAARADLEADRKRKLAEEIERHRLQITVSPLSYAVVSIPVARHDIRVVTDQGSHTVRLRRDLALGQVESFYCLECETPVKEVALQLNLAAETCPLGFERTAWGCLALAGTWVEAESVPVVVGLDPTGYAWRRVIDSSGSVYLGESSGSVVAAWFRGSVLIAADKQNRPYLARKMRFGAKKSRQVKL